MAGSTSRTPSSKSASKKATGPKASKWSPASSTRSDAPRTAIPCSQRDSFTDNLGYELDRPSGGGKRQSTSSSSSNMKRGAEEYITKDHGSTKNPEVGEIDAPKMSTAAQQARRKIAQPKSRIARSTTPTSSSGTFGQQPSSGSLFSFGGNPNTSQSFPPPKQQSFNFAAPGASSSFTFGGSNGNAQPVSNPFANLNGTSTGAGSGDDNMMQDSPQKQQSTNIFGSSAPSSNGFSFGQPAQQPSTNSFSFGQQQKPPEQGLSNGLFGSSQPQTNGFSFGQSTQTTSAPSVFGQPSTSSGAAFGSFGTSGAATDSTPAPATNFKFGETNVVSAADEKKQEETPKSKPLFSFGQPATFDKPSSDAAPATEPPKPAFSFGQPAATSHPESTPSKAPFAFGQPAGTPTQSAPASAPPKPPSLGFGQSAATPSSQPAPANLFGSVSKPEPASSGKPGESGDNTDASPPTESEDKPKNPFASLFANKPSGDGTSESAKPKPTFQFGQTTSFGSPANPSNSTSTTDPFASKSADRPALDAGSRSTSSFQFPQPNAPSGGLFSPKKSDPPSSSSNLFNLNKATSAAQPSKDESTPVKPSTTTSSIPTPKTSNLNVNAGSTPFKAFGQPSHKTNAAESLASASQPAKKHLFTGSSTPDSMAKSAGVSMQDRISSAPSEPVEPKATVPQKPALPRETVNRAVSTEGPPQIPRYLSADKYKSYDENWRLRALNRRLKNVIGTLDPDKHDFLNLIQNYLDHREAIGAPGLEDHGRPKLDVAGTKRKTADVDDLDVGDSENKKSKPAPAFSASNIPKPATPSSSNIFASVASPRPASSSPAKPSDSSTSSLFKSMIPGANSNTIGFTPTFGSTNTSSSTPFGSTSAPKSTTPPSSPPKSTAAQPPKFEIPRFGGGAQTNFANSFAQAAAKTAEKAEKEAREKRKAEEFDSDEDDEETWNKKYEEEQRAKKAKIEAAMKGGLKAGFLPSASSSRSNSPFTFAHPVKSIETDPPVSGDSKETATSVESDGDEGQSGSRESGDSADDEQEPEATQNEQSEEGDDDEEEDDEEQNEDGSPIPDIAPEDSLFARLDPGQMAKKKAEEADNPIAQPTANKSFKPGSTFGNIGKGTPDAPNFSPLTPAPGPKGDFVPTKTFNFTPTPGSSTPTFGALKDGPIPGEGLFGSRPSTPQPSSGAEPKPANPFGTSFGTYKSFGSSFGADNTWKAGSPIKFNGDKDKDALAPSVEVTSATPPTKEHQKPFGKLFGEATSSAVTNPPISNGTFTGFNFGQKPSASSATPAPGFLSVAPHLAPGGSNSATSSRANSPGMTSEAESVATDNTDDYSNDPQTSLMNTGPGEENEDILYESKATLSRNFKKDELSEKTKHVEGWNKMGSGSVKILKDKDTGKTRIVFRAEPGANVLLNAHLIETATYSSIASGRNGAVSFPVATDKGFQTWLVKVKTKADSDRMAEIMKSNQKN